MIYQNIEKSIIYVTFIIFEGFIGKSGWYGDGIIYMKCSKTKQNHTIHTFAEWSEAQRIYMYKTYMPSEARQKIFWGTISVKTSFAIIKSDI